MGCCSKSDKIHAVREKVRKGYAAIATTGGSCCGPAQSCCGGGDADGVAKAVGYSDAELGTLPEGSNMGLSCGNPGAIAALRPVEVVLDLGSGGGFDVFLVAQKVGRKGRAIGVDMTPEMLGPAHESYCRADRAGYKLLVGTWLKNAVLDGSRPGPQRQ